MLQLHYRLWLFTSAAWWKIPIIRFISGPMWSRKKVKKGLKYYDVKQLYFQSEFENLASLSPQKSTIVYTLSKSWMILDPNKAQKSLHVFPFCFPPKNKNFAKILQFCFFHAGHCVIITVPWFFMKDPRSLSRRNILMRTVSISNNCFLSCDCFCVVRIIFTVTFHALLSFVIFRAIRGAQYTQHCLCVLTMRQRPRL